MSTGRSEGLTLTINIPKADYDDLSNGLYKLHFTKQVTDVAKKPLGVWAYKALDGLSKEVTPYEPKNNTETEVQFEVPLTNLSGPSGAGDIKYKLSYLKPGDTLANGDPLPTPIDKAFIKTLFDTNDSLATNTITTRAVDIIEQKSYKIVADDIVQVPADTESWADKPWTVGFENPNFKVLPIILKGEGTTFSAFYNASWWIKGKGRLSLPQQDNVSIWFANTGGDNAIGVSVEDFSEPMALVLRRGKNYRIRYTQAGWGALIEL